MTVPTDTPSTDGAPDPEEVIARRWAGYAPGEPAVIHQLDREAARDILADLAAAGLRVVPEDRPARPPSTESEFVQLPSAPEIARWFIATLRAGEFENPGGSAVILSDNPWCSVWHLAAVDHDEQTHHLLDVLTNDSHDLLYVTAGLREELGCEWRQQPSEVMPWGYDALVWFAGRIEFANESHGVPLVWMDDLDDEPAGVPALDDDTRREVPEVLLTFAKWADWYLEDGCRRDHHGNCQAHGLDKDCPVGPMREWLAAYLGGTDGRS